MIAVVILALVATVCNGVPIIDLNNDIVYPLNTHSNQVTILNQDQEVNFDGSFHSNYDTSDGTSVRQQGVLKNVGQENVIQEITGSYKYRAPDGQEIEISYIANENGFQPVGDHLPTPYPIPDYIQKSLGTSDEVQRPTFTQFVLGPPTKVDKIVKTGVDTAIRYKPITRYQEIY